MLTWLNLSGLLSRRPKRAMPSAPEMWIPPYHRDLVPAGIDHGTFGSNLVEASLVDSMSAFGRARVVEELRPFAVPASSVYGALPAGIRHFEACTARFHVGITDPAPTVLFLPDHAALIDDGPAPLLISESLWHSQLFFSAWFRNDRTTDWRWKLKRDWTEARRIEDTIGIGYHAYHYQYFHWFVDVLPRVWALQRSRAEVSRWFVGPLTQKFQVPSLALLGITPDQCVSSSNDEIVTFEQGVNVAFRFEEPLNTLRPDFRSGVYGAGWSAEFCDHLRDRAQAAFGPPPSGAPERIYVARGDATHRRILNDQSVVSLLDEFGFTAVTPGQMSFEQQVATFSAARCIVGTHGAGLTNLLWAPAGARVIEFMPSGLFDVGYRFLAPLAGHAHAVVVCEPSTHELGLPYADIEVDIEALRQALRDAFA